MTPSEERRGDQIEIGALAEVHRVLVRMHQHFRDTCHWITSHVQRTNRSLAMFNLLSAVSEYLHVAAHNLQTHASVLALATRSLYELNLRCRHLLASDDNIRLWEAEALRDKREVLEGILSLQTAEAVEQERATLRSEIDRLESLVKKYQLPTLERIPNTATIAQSVGRSDEHKALFKLFSKIVHPSSYLVNDYGNAASGEVSIVLQMHAQFYAWDTFNRICDALGVPEARRALPDEKV